MQKKVAMEELLEDLSDNMLLVDPIEESLFMAKVAFDCKQLEEAIEYVLAAKDADRDLTPQERTLLVEIFKVSFKQRRAVVRGLQKEKYFLEKEGQRYLKESQERAEDLCYEAINLMHSGLLPKAKTVESKTYYYAAIGQFQTYLLELEKLFKKEVNSDLESSQIFSGASQSFEAARSLASQLYPLNPVRLNAFLYSCRYSYLFLHRRQESLCLLKSVYAEALEVAFQDEQAHLGEAQARESAALMHALNEQALQWEEEEAELEAGRVVVTNGTGEADSESEGSPKRRMGKSDTFEAGLLKRSEGEEFDF